MTTPKYTESRATGDVEVQPLVNVRKVENLIMFSNGAFVAFDKNGQQIAELQSKTAIDLWCRFATESGFDVVGCVVKMQAPGGPGIEGKIQTDSNGPKLRQSSR